MTVPDESGVKIAVIGLGYVGLPLAVEFGKVFDTVGFDISQQRVADINAGVDKTKELTTDDLAQASRLTCAHDVAVIADCNVFVVTVPTPIDRYKRPDLRPLISASTTVGSVLKRGNVVIYESTVYPGCTEEDCVPVLERESGLQFNQDFSAGYSPERINPGDKEHRLPDIKKVTSGSTQEAADFVDGLYAKIIRAGTHKAPSIKVAEAAKVIENTQRDVNIALVNELSSLFHKLGIDTLDVLEAAGTKWNFLPFRPGLVGGHCIGVDPYYLTHKAQSIGHHPEVILAGRRINDAVGAEVANRTVQLMLERGLAVAGAKVLVLGLAFKENCPDLRNTRVVDVIHQLERYQVQVDVFDPCVDGDEAKQELGIHVLADRPAEAQTYAAVIIAVTHSELTAIPATELRNLLVDSGVLFDVKGALQPDAVDGRL